MAINTELRDYFAAKAMEQLLNYTHYDGQRFFPLTKTGYLSHSLMGDPPSEEDLQRAEERYTSDRRMIAAESYAMADFMLAARLT